MTNVTEVDRVNLSNLAGLCLLLLLLVGCSSEAPEVITDSNIANIIARLQSEDLDVRKAAVSELDELSKAGLSKEGALLALRSASRTFPPLEYEWQSASGQLLRAASSSPIAPMVEIVRSEFDGYVPSARTEALTLLTLIPNDESAVLYTELVVEHGADIQFLPTRGFEQSPRSADVLFPTLFRAMEWQGTGWGVAALALKYFDEGEMARGALDAHYEQIESQLADSLARARSFAQEDDPDWIWADDYQDTRSLAGLLLDLSGYFLTEDSARHLRAALEIPDPRLRFFSARALMAQGQKVPDDLLAYIAASDEVRNYLFEYLSSSNQEQRFPAEFLSQEAFARSDMVNWLIYPTELGRAPSEIEAIRTVEEMLGGEDYLYYVFRFRTDPPHWAAEDGWMLGVSGPFLESAAPSTTSYGDTFSTFAKLEDTNVDDYVAEVRSLLAEWAERQSQ